MQEGQVTIGDRTIPLPDPFWVLATQNPIEHEGTYPLPEAQLDRFLLKLTVGYPDCEAELAMIDLPDTSERSSAASLPPLFGPAEVRGLRARAAAVHVADPIKAYIVDLIRATRDPAAQGLGLAPLIELGASPRATLALVRAAKAHALLSGRDYVTPHDVKSLAPDVLRHRIVASYEADAGRADLRTISSSASSTTSACRRAREALPAETLNPALEPPSSRTVVSARGS